MGNDASLKEADDVLVIAARKCLNFTLYAPGVYVTSDDLQSERVPTLEDSIGPLKGASRRRSDVKLVLLLAANQLCDCRDGIGGAGHTVAQGRFAPFRVAREGLDRTICCRA